MRIMSMKAKVVSSVAVYTLGPHDLSLELLARIDLLPLPGTVWRPLLNVFTLIAGVVELDIDVFLFAMISLREDLVSLHLLPPKI